MLKQSDVFKKTMVLTPLEKKFQSGVITPEELKDIFFVECRADSAKIPQYVGLIKHMKDEAVNTVGAMLYKIDAQAHPQLVLRGDNIARAFAIAHCSRVLGNKKDNLIAETLKSIEVPVEKVIDPNTPEEDKKEKEGKKEKKEIIMKLNSDDLKALIPPLLFPLETCINSSRGTPGDEVQKKALHDLIAFNLIKPVVLKSDPQNLELAKTTFKLDKTVVDTLFKEYEMQKAEQKEQTAKTVSKKEQDAPPPLKPPGPEKSEKPEPPPGPAKPKVPEQQEGRPNQGITRRRP